MHAEGHQIGSHTWSHENASALTNNQFTNQMVWNEIAFNSILGFFPTYMRSVPPLLPSIPPTLALPLTAQSLADHPTASAKKTAKTSSPS